MVITEIETYWQLTVQWGWGELGYTNTHISLHKKKPNAEQRAYRVIRETTGLAGEHVALLRIAENEDSSHADLKAGNTEFSYSIIAVEVEP